MRELILDTETTGLDPLNGDRLVEIGCIEVFNHIPTGKTYHQYINPERDMPAGALAVHGLSEEFLGDFPVFAKVVDDFLNFIASDPLVIHNAKFDIDFLNSELRRLNRPVLPMSRTVDTVAISRRRFPGAPASLDALCRRFAVDNSSRTKHGALLDAELLAEVYLELRGGRQPDLGLASVESVAMSANDSPAPADIISGSNISPPRPHSPTADEIAAHETFVSSLENSLWFQVVDAGE
ncbi:MAG: DNA polymerase III subunit epsilon [Alphaproteobacteria bacterium MarineAlpha11_Bin1]|nr:MAG: DNA polymerase III subunit epsilon [Alphaproteobacteria bacterium MarineAlpha11_Bin1]|tara:strand:- start:17694 stop:18407 length:714 start_codon:yes stop_codon:yes gene_type:complete